MKKTIEIDDTLYERADTLKEAVADELAARIEALTTVDADALDKVEEDAADILMELADSATPVYTSEIEDTFYLHSDELDEAYEDSGIYGDNERPANWKAVAICIYLERVAREYATEYIEEEKTRLTKTA